MLWSIVDRVWVLSLPRHPKSALSYLAEQQAHRIAKHSPAFQAAVPMGNLQQGSKFKSWVLGPY